MGTKIHVRTLDVLWRRREGRCIFTQLTKNCKANRLHIYSDKLNISLPTGSNRFPRIAVTVRQCYQRKYYPLGKLCRVGSQTFTKQMSVSSQPVLMTGTDSLSDMLSLFRYEINEARLHRVKNHFKTSHQSNVISHDCIIGINAEIAVGGIDWLIDH